MSLQVTGKAGVYQIKKYDKFVTASLRTAKKDKDGEWQSEFYNAKFVGKCVEKALSLQDKDKVEIKSGILEQNEYNGKKYTNVVVFEFEMQESESLYKADENDSDSLPF